MVPCLAWSGKGAESGQAGLVVNRLVKRDALECRFRRMAEGEQALTVLPTTNCVLCGPRERPYPAFGISHYRHHNNQ